MAIWKRLDDPRGEAQAMRYERVRDEMIARGMSVVLAKVEREWERLYLLLPSNHVGEWLQGLEGSLQGPKDVNFSDQNDPENDPEDRLTRSPTSPIQKLTPKARTRARAKAEAVRLHLAGEGQGAIASALGVSRPTVHNWLRAA